MSARWLPALLLAGACGEPTPAPAAEPPSAYELAPVVARELAAAEAQLSPPPELPAPDEEAREAVLGLLATLASRDARMRELALEGTREMGARALGVLVERLGEAELPVEERAAAAKLIAQVDHPRAAEALAAIAETSRDPLLRAHAYWNLGARGDDRVLPRLLLRLKYETDGEALHFLGEALAALGNFAGLAPLRELARGGDPSALARGVDEALAVRARETLARLAADAGVADDWELLGAWEAGTLPSREPSPGLRAELWRALARLSSEHFQLRGVDDARWTLSRLGSWAAPEIARALRDEDLHLRLHATQVLARMGARAAAAGAALVEALRGDPALAPAAAEALGAIGYAPAFEPLLEAAGAGAPFELRVAALRGLAALGDERGLERARSLLDDASEPTELRRAAAAALVALGAGDDAAPWLAADLARERGDPVAAEAALEGWLARGAAEERPGFAAALEHWRSLDTTRPGGIPTPEEARALRAARAGWIASALDELLASR